jgi:magnesium-transporting ATPase (P-type)
MKNSWNRWLIILFCALFNLSFEYSARGITQFVTRPLFVLSLFGIYLTYFAMLEDLIIRHRLTNYQLFLVAFLYGLLPTAFLTGNLFNREIYWGVVVAGVNVGTVLIIGILAWGVVQGMITLYLANRLSRRDWNHPKMGPIGWALCIVYQVAILAYARTNPVTPRGTLIGYVTLTALVVIAAVLLVWSLRSSKGQARPFRPSIVMDILAFGSVFVYLVLGTCFVFGSTIVTSQPLNELAVKLENVWVFVCGIVFFPYRLLRRSDVAV